MRTKDANTAWTSASDGTREEERYYAQNWRGDVSLIVKDTGAPVEWVKYSSYGVPLCIKAGDVNSDGNCTGTGAGTDYNTIAGWPHGTYDARARYESPDGPRFGFKTNTTLERFY